MPTAPSAPTTADRSSAHRWDADRTTAPHRAPIVGDLTLRAACHAVAGCTVVGHHLRGACRGERGEGVISAAIAVLIMAALGVVMWVGFQEIWGDAKTNTQNEVTRIGS